MGTIPRSLFRKWNNLHVFWWERVPSYSASGIPGKIISIFALSYYFFQDLKEYPDSCTAILRGWPFQDSAIQIREELVRRGGKKRGKRSFEDDYFRFSCCGPHTNAWNSQSSLPWAVFWRLVPTTWHHRRDQKAAADEQNHESEDGAL